MQPLSVIWVGNPFFFPGLRDMGWRVHWINPGPDRVLNWSALVAEAGFAPDLVVAADKSTPPMITGMENFPCLTALYAVDTHIHSWHPCYALAFDVCLVSLKDDLSLFTTAGLAPERVWWSPPYSHPHDAPCPPDPATPLCDMVFVGTVDPALNPARHAFLEKLGRHLPGLCLARGSYREQFGRARLVLNHAIHRDLNFRVFEALGCGACLLTPRVGHGLEELFRDGEHLFMYEPDDMEGLVRLTQTLLADPQRCVRVAAQGHQVVNARHRLRHRAETFACNINVLRGDDGGAAIVAARQAKAPALHKALRLMYLLHADTAPYETAKAAYLQAASR